MIYLNDFTYEYFVLPQKFGEDEVELLLISGLFCIGYSCDRLFEHASIVYHMWGWTARGQTVMGSLQCASLVVVVGARIVGSLSEAQPGHCLTNQILPVHSGIPGPVETHL